MKTALYAATPGATASFAIDDRMAHDLVRDLHEIRPSRYWLDLIATSSIGWSGFVLAVILRPFSPAMAVAAAIAVIGLYRGLVFVHEISHVSPRVLPGFETAWNLLIGYPLLLPSFVYVGVHRYHHQLSSYGTPQDPEYLPLARSGPMTVMFALESFLIPVILVVRFGVLAPLGLLSRRFQRWLVAHFSSLTINVKYCRDATPELTRSVRRHSVSILLLWGILACLAAAHIVPWRLFAVWMAVSAGISFINTIRTLGAHIYQSTGEPMDRAGQLADSIDTPGALWTELWAPVGLRYHALHHYFPGIPYHNLRQAWVRLSLSLPAGAPYHQVRSPGLAHSLRALLRNGFRRSG